MSARTLAPTRGGRPIVDSTRFPCGDPRTPENTIVKTVGTTECRACKNRRNANAATKRKQDRLAPTLMPVRGKRVRRPIPPTPRLQALLEEARVEYVRAVASMRDSTDAWQRSFWGKA